MSAPAFNVRQWSGGTSLARAVPAIICVLIIVGRGASMLGTLQDAADATYEGPASVVGDASQRSDGSTRIVLRINNRRWQAYVYGASAAALVRSQAGDHLVVRARLKAWRGRRPGWAIARHLSGSASVTSVAQGSRPAVPWRAASWVRRRYGLAASALPTHYGGLFRGFVLGDASGLDVPTTEDFRAAGLSHLLVVSGQNVAFVMVAFQPLLRRFNRGLRAGFTLSLIASFALLTRFEPSVLRASSMAAVVVVSQSRNRPQPRLRSGLIAVVGVLMWDPLLVCSLGFALSVAATGGMIVLAPRLEVLMRRRIPGWLAAPTAATVGAQIATYPLLLSLGGTSPAALPANLAALPFAEPVMVWGVVVGLPASFLPPMARSVAVSPCAAALWWIVHVARVFARISVALAAPWWWPVFTALVLWLLLRSRRRQAHAWGRAVVCSGLAATLWMRGLETPMAGRSVSGALVWRSERRVVVAVPSASRLGGLVPDLRRARIRAIDVLIVNHPTHTTWTALRPLLQVYPPRRIVACGTAAAQTSLGAVPVVTLSDAHTAHLTRDRRPWLRVRCATRTAIVESDEASAWDPSLAASRE